MEKSSNLCSNDLTEASSVSHEVFCDTKYTAKLCQENIRCAQGEVANFYCQECLTYQCSSCEVFLHSTRELKVHLRHSISSECAILSRKRTKVCKLWCSPKNGVSVTCQQCEMDLCKECDDKMHQGRRQGHLRHRYVAADTVIEPETSQSSHLLVNAKEELLLSDEKEFVELLHCNRNDKIKVVSIFGNTGDGKSHTLNHTFFAGSEVFKTSSNPQSCTVGIWAAYSSQLNALFLDSEGLLGTSQNENRRTRLLLKILAISDVVIYRTRAERLHNDLFTFLGDASDAYWKYFAPELKNASDRCKLNIPLSTLGPSVVIFHETQHTELLGEGASDPPLGTKLRVMLPPEVGGQMSPLSDEDFVGEIMDNVLVSSDDERDNKDVSEATPPMTAEELLKIRFSEVGCIPKAFSSVEYVGTRTQWPPTDFTDLLKSVTTLLKNNAVRAPRTPAIVLKALQLLNAKFNGDIVGPRASTFPDEYFSCPQTCLACGVHCELSMNHDRDGLHHKVTATRCKYSPSHDNKVYLCKACFNRGIENPVFPKTSSSGDSGWIGLAKYAWSGYVIECKHCGVIYRSRQHWYGNKDPELQAVRTENKHVWPEDIPSGQISDNTARRLLDGMGNMADAVSSVSSRPARMVAEWMSNQVAPKYWVPNNKITVCHNCKQEFTPSMTKHHCRACGEGFCDKCSSKNMPVPWRGWGNVPVRVCNACYKRKEYLLDKRTVPAKQSSKTTKLKEENRTKLSADEGVTPRYVGEMIQSALGFASGVITYPKGIVVESARPAYWVADEQITHCHKCKVEFNYHKDSKHHCRACGQGFCDKCSSNKAPVPTRGWDYPVRVCDGCLKIIKN